MDRLWRSLWCTRWCAGNDDGGVQPIVTTGDPDNGHPRSEDEQIADRLTKLELDKQRTDTRVMNLQNELADRTRRLEDLEERIRRSVHYPPHYVSEEQEEAAAAAAAAATIYANVVEMPEQENEAGFRRLPIIERPAHTINVHPDDCYKMDHRNRGTCIVFYHKYFKDEDLSTVRVGAENELEAVEKTFNKLGFKLDVHKDKTYKKICEVLEELKTRDFREDDCLSIVVMSHGGDNDTIWAYDNEYPIEIFEKTLSQINQLKEKPKLIFVQACRGQKIDKGIQLRECNSKIWDRTDCFNGSIQPRKWPSGAEFYIVQSALPGYRSWRNWFLPILCTVLDEYSNAEDINSILRRTNELIAKKESSCDDVELDKAKQILIICHNLTKFLFLKNKQIRVIN